MFLEYMKGLFFVVMFVSIIYLFGKSIHQAESFSENYIIGYILYTCLQFIGGFLCQQLRLPWWMYQAFMIITIIFLCYYIFYQKKMRVTLQQCLNHIREYWLLYFLVVILVCLALLNLDYLWNGNNTDDGYYLNKIRMAPYVSSYVDYNYATGFPAPSSIVRNLNTFEIEAAFYCQFLGMDASIYAKVFLAAIHYIVLLNAVYWFFQATYAGDKKKFMIYALVPILFFGIYQEIMLEKHWLVMSDAWQFNSAMWFGSTLVRTAGFFILMTPFLKESISVKEGTIFFCATAMALLSKSSQTLPLLFLVCASYLFSVMLCSYRKHQDSKLIYGMVGLILIGILMPLPNHLLVRKNAVFTLLIDNARSFLFICALLIIISALLVGNQKMKRWSMWLLMIGCFIFIPRINHLFLLISIYDFVAERMVTLYIFSIIMSASFFLFIWISKYVNKGVVYYAIYFALSCICVYYPIKYVQRTHGIKFSVKILAENQHLIPNATMELGDALQSLKQRVAEPLYVLAPTWFKNYNIPHSPATSLRYNAFDIYSIGACGRYAESELPREFQTYTADEQLLFDMYNSGEYRDNAVIKTIFDRFPINCLIVTYEEAAHSLAELGFKVEDKVKLDDSFTYYILLKQ